MNEDRTCLFGVSFEVTTLCNYVFSPSFMQRCKCRLQASFRHLFQCLRRCTSSELENRCLLSKFFIRGKSHKGRDQENKPVVEILECDVLTGNLTAGGTRETAYYCDGVFTPSSRIQFL
ncbi:hypothetical protein AVEN_50147-1 [Araneus ventricosus]|uniref:Uncharacterized protein n=1 Tax=Araneus ventricosus TaxID=182803 RepID=A0A4Y2DAI9_ARAVE|nr:hypothetical protein AVEN_50147-1 [Araneus ventricosus]